MLDALMKRPLLTLGVLGGAGVVTVGVVLGVVLMNNEPTPEKEDTAFTTTSTDGPFITVESADLNGDVGRAQPVRIRVEDGTGVATLRILLGGETVWEPDVLRGQTTVYTTYPWIPDATGEYEFEILVNTVDDRTGSKKITLSAGCCPPEGDVNIGYTVEEGDDIGAIIENFGLCFNDLLAANPGLEEIAPGDVLKIPYRASSEANSGERDPSDCEPIPLELLSNPLFRSNLERRDTAYPVAGGRITRGFGCAEYFTGYRGTSCPDNMPWFHTGIDISIEEGSPITTVDAGVVTYAGPDVTSNADCSSTRGSDSPHNGYGRHVRIERGSFLFLYAHLSGLASAAGSSFDGSGYLLGYAGSTGCSTGTHLHLEVRQSGISIDPLIYIEQVENQ